MGGGPILQVIQNRRKVGWAEQYYFQRDLVDLVSHPFYINLSLYSNAKFWDFVVDLVSHPFYINLSLYSALVR